MFQKTKQQEPQQPQLLGEDFDIFPDIHAHDQDDERKEVDQEKPVQSNETAQTPEPDEPDEPTDFEKKIAAIEPHKWKQLQILAGIILGIVSSVCITWLGNLETFKNFGLIFAAVIAILLPTMFERYARRSIRVLRTTLVIVVIIIMVSYFFYGLVLNPGYFKS